MAVKYGTDVSLAARWTFIADCAILCVVSHSSLTLRGQSHIDINILNKKWTASFNGQPSIQQVDRSSQAASHLTLEWRHYGNNPFSVKADVMCVRDRKCQYLLSRTIRVETEEIDNHQNHCLEDKYLVCALPKPVDQVAKDISGSAV